MKNIFVGNCNGSFKLTRTKKIQSYSFILLYIYKQNFEIIQSIKITVFVVVFFWFVDLQKYTQT